MLNTRSLQNGQEQHEEYYSHVNRKNNVQYDYRDIDGTLFSCVKRTLIELVI